MRDPSIRLILLLSVVAAVTSACGRGGSAAGDRSAASSTTATTAAESTTSTRDTSTSTAAQAVATTATTARRPRPATTTTTLAPNDAVTTGQWTVNLDGTGLRQLPDGVSAWSPDGRSVAIASEREIRIISADDGHVEGRIRRSEPSTLVCLDWSTQGRLAWIAREPATLWMADAPGGEAREVDRDWPGGECRWSPDGSRLAVSGEGVRLYSAEGTTLETVPLGTDVAAIHGLIWSPDGSVLAGLEWVSRGDAPNYPGGLWVKPVDGEARSWPSPTGGRIYRLDRDPGGGGFYARVDGRSHDWTDGNGIWRFDVGTGEGVLVAKGCCINAFQVLPGGGFIGITTSKSFTDDTIALFNADGSLRTVVVRGHPLLPEDDSGTGLCDGTRFWSLDLAPTGDRVLLVGTGRYATWRCDYVSPL